MSILDTYIVDPKKTRIMKDAGSNVYTDPRYRAKEFLKIQPMYYDVHGLWWKWNQEHYYWQYVEDEVEILNLVYDQFQLDTIQANIKRETLEGLRQESRRLKPEDIKDSWIQYGKTIYDIATGEQFESTPKYFNTNPIFVQLGDSESTPTVDKLFNSWVKAEDVDKLYQHLAYATIPKMIIHAFISYYGPPGGGKSTMLNLIENFVGKHNTVSTSIERINSNPRFETLKWHRKLLIKISEVSNIYDLKSSAVINNATGEDSIPAEKKGGSTFDFTNYGKFFNPTNKLLKVDPTDGFGRRVRVINFTNRFEVEKDVLTGIPEIEFQNLAKKCLRIAGELWKTRRFAGDLNISERMEEYQKLSRSILETFVAEFYEEADINDKVSFKEFEIDYHEYLKRKKHVIPYTNALSKEIRDPKGLNLQIIKNNNITWIYGLKKKI